VEKEAQAICAKLIALRRDRMDEQADEVADFKEIDVNSVDFIRLRSVGPSNESLRALESSGWPIILKGV
jgi:hypothetical protein